MNVVIKRREDVGISQEEIVDLLHESFQERLNQGLHYSCSSMTVERFKEKTRDEIVLCAIEENTNSLVGVGAIRLCDGISRYGYLEYDAVRSDAKHQGIGSKLLNARIKLAQDFGAEYVLSDTSVKAESAINYFIKNGFQIIGYESYRSTNYWSYVFRLQLKHPSIWDSAIYRNIHRFISLVFIKLTRTIDGQDTRLGMIYKKMKCRS